MGITFAYRATGQSMVLKKGKGNGSLLNAQGMSMDVSCEKPDPKEERS